MGENFKKQGDNSTGTMRHAPRHKKGAPKAPFCGHNHFTCRRNSAGLMPSMVRNTWLKYLASEKPTR